MATHHQAGDSASMRRFKTYSEKFSDPASDPFGGDYSGIMKLFATKTSIRRSASTSQIISNRVFATAGVQAHAFLHLSLTVDKPTITVLHTPITLVQPMGSSTPDEYVILMGDQRGVSPPLTVYMPDDAFKQVSNVRVPKIETITAALADPTVEELGPYEASDVGTEVVSTSHMMYLPPNYVAAALATPFLTPRQAWEVIGAKITSNPNIETVGHLAPLVDWLRVALVNDPTESPSIMVALDPPTYPYPLSDSLRNLMSYKVQELDLGTLHNCEQQRRLVYPRMSSKSPFCSRALRYSFMHSLAQIIR
jgi:hypothetical protein